MNLPLVIGALLVSILLLWWLMSVIKASFKTAFLIVVVIFAVQVLTGIGPQQIFSQVGQWVSTFFANLGNWLQTWGDRMKVSPDKKEQSLIWLQYITTMFP
ncbi:MAG: hypothetical protein NW214_03365 [Pseudanabaenaceae cyanobacterium bins.39]|nr:hypothetical protein [Pseudanabaenaceae cyanobacterium bins.39]